jgi:hypothetical protein
LARSASEQRWVIRADGSLVTGPQRIKSLFGISGAL